MARRLEVRSCEGDLCLSPFKCAVTLKTRWLSKGPADLIGIFLDNYATKKFGRKVELWSAQEDFELATIQGQAISDCAELKTVPLSLVVRSRAGQSYDYKECCESVKSCSQERRPTTGAIFHLLEGHVSIQHLPNPGLYARLKKLFEIGTLPEGDDLVKQEIVNYRKWRMISAEKRKALKAVVVPRRDDLDTLVDNPPVKLRTKWDQSPLGDTSSLISFVGRNLWDSKGTVFTYEACVSIADYLKKRLAVKPLGYRNCATQIYDTTVVHLIKKICPELDLRYAQDFETALEDRPAILITDGRDDFFDKCKGALEGTDPALKLDVPEILFLTTAANSSSTSTTSKRAETPQQLEGYKTKHLHDISAHLLHIYDDPDKSEGHARLVSIRAVNNRLSLFRDPQEVEHSKAQGTVARIVAQAQRGQPPSTADLRDLEEANAIIASTPEHIKLNVRTPLDDDDDEEDEGEG